MRVRDVMNRRVLTIRADDLLTRAAQTLLWGGVRHLPVVDGGHLVGLLSERDVARHLIGPGAHDVPVRDAMSQPVHTIDPGELVSAAEARLHQHHIGCLPVLDDDEIVGLVTTTHVLAEKVGASLRARGRAPATERTAQDVMTENPVTAASGDLVLDAAARMSQAGVRHLPVVDGDGKLVGIVSDRDVRLAVGDPTHFAKGERDVRTEMLRVGAVMTRGAVTASPFTPLHDLVDLFTDWQVGATPVVDEDERLLGIVSYVDVLRVMARQVGA